MKNLLKIFPVIVLLANFSMYGQAPSINKNVTDNSFRVETWGQLGAGNIVEDYETAKAKTTDKSKLKDLVLDAIYNNEQEKKALDTKSSEKEQIINKLKYQLQKIEDKDSSKYKKADEKLQKEQTEYNTITSKLVKNLKDSNKLQEEYHQITGE
jgi:hypothetical protein